MLLVPIDQYIFIIFFKLSHFSFYYPLLWKEVEENGKKCLPRILPVLSWLTVTNSQPARYDGMIPLTSVMEDLAVASHVGYVGFANLLMHEISYSKFSAEFQANTWTSAQNLGPGRHLCQKGEESSRRLACSASNVLVLFED